MLIRVATIPKILLGVLILLPVLALTQSPPGPSLYQPATIVDVKPHQDGGSNPDEATYEVTVEVKGTIYVVLTPSSSEPAIRYTVGRELLVCVGADTIRWNDLVGTSHEVPIISRTVIADRSTPEHR